MKNTGYEMSKYVLLAFSLGINLLAADWPLIPPEVWAMKEDPVKGIKDAVILEDRTIFNDECMERIRRIRVLNEAGRRATELLAFSEQCHDFSGRTIYPDGNEIIINRRQDFKREITEVGDYSRKLTVLIPPGVTGNCVVELRWKESLASVGGLPPRFDDDELLYFGDNYFTFFQSIEMPVIPRFQIELFDGRSIKAEVNKGPDRLVFYVKNMAPLEYPPFSLSILEDRPFVATYFMSQISAQGWAKHDGFWSAVGRGIWKDLFESEIRGLNRYEVLKAKALNGVSSKEPFAMATQVISVLDREIVNVSHPTRDEVAKWPKGKTVPRSGDLEAICEQKTASTHGLLVLFYNILVDAGYQPKIALLVDRTVRLFQPTIKSHRQATHPAVVIEEPGKGVMLFDPSQRFAAPGLIHPDFQGVQGLLLDPKDGWSAKPFRVPVQPSVFNQRRFEYTLEIGEEEDRFKVNAQFSGFPELVERRRYDEDEQAERNRKLKERFEKQIKGAVIQRAEVQNANNPTTNVGWVVEGEIERDGGRQQQVLPFPGLQYPLNIPDAMPSERNLPIVMPFLQVQSARSRFNIPKGYRAITGQPFEQRNRFGSVLWSAQVQSKGEESLAEVTLKVSVDTMFAGPTAYGDLKTYLGWITEAYKRTLILEKL